MPYVKAALLSRLPPGSTMQVTVEDQEYAICNAAGELHAVQGNCPHAGGPLGYGALHGHMLVCPWHAWEFDCRTGEHDYNPRVRLATYPVKVEGDDVLIEVGDRA